MMLTKQCWLQLSNMKKISTDFLLVVIATIVSSSHLDAQVTKIYNSVNNGGAPTEK